MSGSWGKVKEKKDERSPEEKDKAISNWITAQQKVEVSPINLVMYGLDGTCKCLTKDSLVQLANGDIVDFNKEIRSVFSVGEDGEIEVSETTYQILERSPEEIVEMKLKSGHKLKATPDHLVLTPKGWQEIQSLKLGDYVAVPRVFYVNPTEEATKEDAIILGALLAEGGLTQFKSKITFTNIDADFVGYVSDALEKKGLHLAEDSDASFRIQPLPRIKEFLKEFGMEVGKRSIEKEMPPKILKSDKFNIFMAAYFEGDGEVNVKQVTATFSTSSPRLAQQIQLSLTRFGILSVLNDVQTSYTNGAKKSRKFDSHRIHIRGHEVIKLSNVLGTDTPKLRKLRMLAVKIEETNKNPNLDIVPKECFEHVKLRHSQYWLRHKLGKPEARSYISEILGKTGHNPSRERLRKLAVADGNEELIEFCENDIWWVQVKSIEKLETKQKTYDITVPKNRNYIANGIIVHNSGACMDIREANEMDKKVFVIDIDGSAAPIKEEYWNGDDNIMVVDPIEITVEGDIDWIGSYNRILDVAKWLRKHEAELNLKGVVLDGLDTLLKIAEYKMKAEDLKVNPQARITDLWSWQFRNTAFLLVVKLIKGLKCDRLYTTHLKELKGWVTEAGKGKTLATTGFIPEWEKSTPNLMFQKVGVERIEKGKVVEWKAKVEKSKTNSALEGKVYEVLRVDHAKGEVNWSGIKEFLRECRHKEEKKQ